MSTQAAVGEPSNYFSRLFVLVRMSATQLVRPPSHSRRAEAARKSARHVLLLVAILGAAIITLMYALDVTEIGLMPPRGTLSLWPVRILTDFGKSAYVLWLLAGMLFAVAIISPRLRATSRSVLLGFGTRLQFLFFAVLVPVLTGEAIKWVVGRGRPFVGGEANAFNFAHFAGTEAYASFPSGHAITSFALAFAVSAVWPRARGLARRSRARLPAARARPRWAIAGARRAVVVPALRRSLHRGADGPRPPGRAALARPTPAGVVLGCRPRLRRGLRAGGDRPRAADPDGVPRAAPALTDHRLDSGREAWTHGR